MMEKRSTAGGAMKKVADPRTLFVRFHPPSASITRQHLADHFSNHGPVNRCSVIRQSKPKRPPPAAAEGGGDGEDDDDPANYDRGSKGYGFVRFVHEDDARSAAEATGRTKAAPGGRGRQGGGEVMVVDGVEYRVHAERAVDAAAPRAQKKRKDRESQEKASAPAPAPAAAAAAQEHTAEAEADATATAVTPSKADADKAYQAEAKRKRTSRVIVRNLSFYADERHVRAAMERHFGPVAAVDLPRVPSKDAAAPRRHRGFAFVTFTNAGTARRAVEGGGAKVEVKKRAVAIDFSVSKLEHQRLERERKGAQGGAGAAEDAESGTESEAESGDGSENEEDEEEGSSDGAGSDEEDSSESSDEDEDGDDSESEGDGADENGEEEQKTGRGAQEATKEAPAFDETEAARTLFLRNLPFDATRHDVFELFRKFGRVEAAHLVKDRQTGAFRGTAFVRFGNEGGCGAALEAAAGSGGDPADELFVSSKNVAMGMGTGDGGHDAAGLSLKGRRVLVDRAVDRTTASSLAVKRDADGRPIRKAVGKDRRNLYLKNEGRVAAKADGALAKEAGAAHGSWEDLPPGDRARRERAFADKATKLRSPLFFINSHRISVRNLSKQIDEAGLKRLAFEALKAGLKAGLATPQDAVAHWRAAGELAHAEVARRAADPALAVPPLDEKNVRGAIPSVYVDRDVVAGKKTADAPSRGFGFVEFTHHAHALAALRQLNNNPAYSKEYAAGGQGAAEMGRRGRGKKKGGGKGGGADSESGSDFLNEDGKVCVPRLIVEFTAENKVKAKQQAEKIAQKKANKIKQRIDKKEKEKEEKQQKKPNDKGKDKKKGRGQLQREKKRARKDTEEAGNDGRTVDRQESSTAKKHKVAPAVDGEAQKKAKKATKPPKKRNVDKEEVALEDMIRSYKKSFAKGAAAEGAAEERSESEPKKASREKVVTKRWFE